MFSKTTEFYTSIDGKFSQVENQPSRGKKPICTPVSTDIPFKYVVYSRGNTYRIGGGSSEECQNICLDEHGGVEISVPMEAGSVLIIDIEAMGISCGYNLCYDEVDISDNPPDGIANYLPAEQLYRVVTSMAKGPTAVRTVSLRLESKKSHIGLHDLKWNFKNVRVSKVKLAD